MSRRKLNDWKAYYELEPWGGARHDISIGMLACFIESLFVGPDGTTVTRPHQFIFKNEAPEDRELREHAEAEYREYLEMMAAADDITPTY